MTTRLILHGALTGNCLRAAMALEEASLEYSVVFIDMGRGEHRGSAHLALNPAGKVPTLVVSGGDTDGLVLSQSNAIMLYAARRAPGSLLPDNDEHVARALERYFYFVTDVIAVSHSAWALRSSAQPEAGAMLASKALEALLFAQRHVKDQPFMAGASFSLADIAAFTIAHFMRADIDWDRCPDLLHWYEAIGSRPAIVRGARAFDHR